MLPLKNRTILVVDDEPLIRELVCQALSARGATTVAAGNGLEGFKVYETMALNVILSDVRMPGGDGTELLRKIRNCSAEKPVFCLMSGFSDVSLDSLYEMGADAVYSKPFSMKKVITGITNLMLPLEDRWQEEPIPDAVPVKKTLITNSCLGRGGVFIPGLFDLETDTPVQFHLTFNEQNSAPLEGTGMVRWLRSKGEYLAAGIGVEILTVREPGKSELIKRIREMGPKAFIPQGGKAG